MFSAKAEHQEVYQNQHSSLKPVLSSQTEELEDESVDFFLTRTISGLSSESVSSSEKVAEPFQFIESDKETLLVAEQNRISHKKISAVIVAEAFKQEELFSRVELPTSDEICKPQTPEQIAVQYAILRLGKFTPAKVRFFDTFAFRCGMDHKFTLSSSQMDQDKWCDICEKLHCPFSKYIKKKDGVLLDEYLSLKTKIRCARGHCFTLKPAQ